MSLYTVFQILTETKKLIGEPCKSESEIFVRVAVESLYHTLSVEADQKIGKIKADFSIKLYALQLSNLSQLIDWINENILMEAAKSSIFSVLGRRRLQKKYQRIIFYLRNAQNHLFDIYLNSKKLFDSSKKMMNYKVLRHSLLSYVYQYARVVAVMQQQNWDNKTATQDDGFCAGYVLDTAYRKKQGEKVTYTKYYEKGHRPIRIKFKTQPITKQIVQFQQNQNAYLGRPCQIGHYAVDDETIVSDILTISKTLLKKKSSIFLQILHSASHRDYKGHSIGIGVTMRPAGNLEIEFVDANHGHFVFDGATSENDFKQFFKRYYMSEASYFQDFNWISIYEITFENGFFYRLFSSQLAALGGFIIMNTVVGGVLAYPIGLTVCLGVSILGGACLGALIGCMIGTLLVELREIWYALRDKRLDGKKATLSVKHCLSEKEEKLMILADNPNANHDHWKICESDKKCLEIDRVNTKYFIYKNQKTQAICVKIVNDVNDEALDTVINLNLYMEHCRENPNMTMNKSKKNGFDKLSRLLKFQKDGGQFLEDKAIQYLLSAVNFYCGTSFYADLSAVLPSNKNLYDEHTMYMENRDFGGITGYLRTCHQTMVNEYYLRTSIFEFDRLKENRPLENQRAMHKTEIFSNAATLIDKYF